MNDKLKVAVVILNWNGAEVLRRFLPSVGMGRRCFAVFCRPC